MKTPIIKDVKVKEEYYIEFTDEELAALKMEKGQKYTCMLEDGGLKLTPFVKVDIDITDWDRDILEFLVQESCEQDISVNEIITDVIEKVIES